MENENQGDSGKRTDNHGSDSDNTSFVNEEGINVVTFDDSDEFRRSRPRRNVRLPARFRED